MKAAGIEDKVDELAVALDRDIEHIEESLLRLNELRSLVIKHDNVSLGKLLEGIEAESESYKEQESRRRAIREELASALGCSFEEMTLSRLEAGLSEGRRAEVTERKDKLRSLIGELKKEYLRTVMLLSDCARFNRLLLKSVFDLGKIEIITYGSKGDARRQGETAFVNMRI